MNIQDTALSLQLGWQNPESTLKVVLGAGLIVAGAYLLGVRINNVQVA